MSEVQFGWGLNGAPTMNEFYNTEDMCVLLSCSKKKLYPLARDRQIPCVTFVNQWLFPVQGVQLWLQADALKQRADKEVQRAEEMVKHRQALRKERGVTD